MNDVELEVIGFYRARLAESWALLELSTKWMPEEMARATSDHLAKARAIVAKVESVRERKEEEPEGRWYDADGCQSPGGMYDQHGRYHPLRAWWRDCE